jgi:hypothetical protein
MALDATIRGSGTGNGAEVSGTNQLKVIPEVNVTSNPNNVGGVKTYGENDDGSILGEAALRSPEIDVDYRQRTSLDLLLEEEIFSYTTQNTGKYAVNVATMTAGFTAGNFTTNSGSITTTSTGLQAGSYAYFPNTGTQTLSFDFELAFSSQPVTNTTVDFGGFVRGVSNPFVPLDGVFFRLTSAGLQGVASYNGTETSTGVFPAAFGSGTPWTYVNNKKYQFIIYVGGVEAVFWVNDGVSTIMLGNIQLPVAQGRICMAGSLPWSIRHAIAGGAAGGVLQVAVGAVNVRIGGSNIGTTASTQGNRIYGSYQGLAGGTMGSLSNLTNNLTAAATAPTNTTAAFGTSLGGEYLETDTLAVNTDGIIMSYQVPSGTVNQPARRLVVRGVKIQSAVNTALTGGGYIAIWSICFGHTSVALTSVEGAAAKAARRIVAGKQVVASAAAALTMLQDVYVDLGDAPIFVNPGEFFQIAKRKVGTAPSAGNINHTITVLFGWE